MSITGRGPDVWTLEGFSLVAGAIRVTAGRGLDTGERIDVVPVEQLAGAARWLERFGGHLEDCNTLSGAPECSCGWDEAYTKIRAAVRSGALPLPRTDQPKEDR